MPRPIVVVMLALAPAACGVRSAPTRPLVTAMTHPVETRWSTTPDGSRELRFVASVSSNAGRDTPPTKTYPCVSLEIRAVGSIATERQHVACDDSVTPPTPTDMTRAAEALLGAPKTSWTHGHFLTATGHGWLHGLVVLPAGSAVGVRGGSIAEKKGDLFLPGLECDAWGDRDDCVIQEYEATVRKAGVHQVMGFLSDVPERSAVILVNGTPLTTSAITREILVAHPGPHLPIRVRAWPSIPKSPTAEDVWLAMEAEGKLPP